MVSSCQILRLSLMCREAFLFFFFSASAPTAIYTLSLHDALPIFGWLTGMAGGVGGATSGCFDRHPLNIPAEDRKSTRLNSSHASTSYAVFCLKKKKVEAQIQIETKKVSAHVRNQYLAAVQMEAMI